MRSRSQSRSLGAATFRKPSAVRNVPIGVIVGWWFPACPGSSPSTVQRAAWKSSIESSASIKETRTHWPRPLCVRSSRASRIPVASSWPAAMSAIAIPTRVGGVPGSPVMLIRPLMPWMI